MLKQKKTEPHRTHQNNLKIRTTDANPVSTSSSIAKSEYIEYTVTLALYVPYVNLDPPVLLYSY